MGTHAQLPYRCHVRICNHTVYYDLPVMPTEAERAKTRAQVRQWRRDAIERAGVRKCECGCGASIPALRADGITPRRFVNGHQHRRPVGTARLDGRGYLIETTTAGTERQHRIAWEKTNGPIPPGMHVHHINGDKTDNRIENLRVIEAGEHADLHWRERKVGETAQCDNIEHLKAQERRNSGQTAEQVVELRRRVAAGEQLRAVSADLGIDEKTASKIWKGVTWRCRTCGQPKRRPSRRKDSVLRLRLSEPEKTVIRCQAELAGLSMSEYLRQRVIGDLGVGTGRGEPGARERMPDPPPWSSTDSSAIEDDLEAMKAKVKRENPGTPERNLHVLAVRELQRGR